MTPDQLEKVLQRWAVLRTTMADRILAVHTKEGGVRLYSSVKRRRQQRLGSVRR